MIKITSHKIWENRNPRAVVWQGTLTVNGKGREREREKEEETEVKSMEETREEKERRRGAREEDRQGSKSSKTQCMTQMHQ